MIQKLIGATFIASVLALPVGVGAQPGSGYGKGPGPAAGTGPGYGAGPGPGPGKGMMQNRWTRERMYGTPLMTLEERQEFQRQMWNAKTVEERQKIRDEHRKAMAERAKQQNFKIEEGKDDTISVPALPAQK